MRRNSGFSLLEILVAFTVLAMVLGIVFQIFARGSHSARLSDEYVRATYIAESIIARANYEEDFFDTSGMIDDKYHWEINLAPYEVQSDLGDDILAANTTARSELESVEVKVSWGEPTPRSIALVTLRLSLLK